MKEFIEKLIDRLEEESDYEPIDYDYCDMSCSDEEHFISTHKAIQIVSQLAKEYVPDTNAGNKDGWIPVEERLPDSNKYIMLSFSNFSLLAIGRYEEDSEGGAFYIGDEEESCVAQDMFVNAWRELPEPYKAEGE